MALTAFQVDILRRLSQRRREEGVSYIAGGVALNEALRASRVSRDIDVFHDTAQALSASWSADNDCLVKAGFAVELVRETPSFVEATVRLGENEVLVQWLRDSAYRFFPVIEHELLGLTLHPFDLATNKVLALAGRLEPRDWIDTIQCHNHLQPLGFLIWAACGKDPGVSPDMLLSDASRHHYAQPELDVLDYDAPPPSAANLGREWREAVSSARQTIDLLPEEHIGECILSAEGTLYRQPPDRLEDDMKAGVIRYHKGSIGGAWPQVVSTG